MISVFFKTFGCQANVADSENLRKYLSGMGCKSVDTAAEADLIIINTCAIRDKAEQKIFSYIGQLADCKKAKPYVRIGVIGCVASYRKKEMYTRFDHVGFVFGAKEDLSILRTYLSDSIEKLETSKRLYKQDPDGCKMTGWQDRDVSDYVQRREPVRLNPSRHSLLRARSSGRTGEIDKTAGEKECLEYKSQTHEKINNPFALRRPSCPPKPWRRGKAVSKGLTERTFARSFINIMTGCNNYCTYCIVPFTRGREISYPMREIVQHVERDVANGVKEITLIGQNVNSYKDPETGAGFEKLLENVAQVAGEFWVRFVSPHPKDMTKDVLDVIAKYPGKLCAFIHLPLQSGSNKILAAMNRTYTREQYLEQVEWIRERLPNAAIFTDVIVGFPGESQEDYQQTREIMEIVRYDQMFSFVYSPRKYTKAAEMEDNCSSAEKHKRLTELQTRQREICAEQNKKNIGKKIRVLVEDRLKNGSFLARTAGNIRVMLDDEQAQINEFVDVLVYDADVVHLYVRPVQNVHLGEKVKEQLSESC